ncbi:glycoside hydrolase [Linderina pennispora]|uniref:Glycoside hydrolase n=1 Tax=Linderina pennispora TaxID=61395 RepID=A0A1Y1VX60_9FUNG|nr:glycoside hydrolase [Linderina pennispora]ORX65862.1 glycoside hydrolase [Linderina pennispora]
MILFKPRHCTLLALAVLAAAASAAYSSTCANNVVTYWGQNSWGGSHLNDPDHWEQDLAKYCQGDTFDIINLSFVTNYNTSGLPVLNHAGHCETRFNGTNTVTCPDIGADIKTCQAKGIKIVLSLDGGGIYSYVDLDIESGDHTGYAGFISQLRTHFASASKQYVISAAPQCAYPDYNLDSTLRNAWIDNNYVQFYNNPCNLANIDNQWNFGYKSWDALAKKNPTPDSKVYIGLPAGPAAAGNGYLKLSTLKTDIMQLYSNYSSTFGGIMLWDASWYSSNREYVQELATWVKTSMNCGASASTPASSAVASS